MLACVACSWVVITALSALVCTGAVLGFVFLRGLVPSPYDAITISNSGNGGYAGNNGYQGYAPPFSASTSSLYWEQTGVSFLYPFFMPSHHPPPSPLSPLPYTYQTSRKAKKKQRNVYAVRHSAFVQ